MEIKKRLILITGANRGIGKAFAEMCAGEGAHLILANRTLDLGLPNELLQKGAASVDQIEFDIGDAAAIPALLKSLNDREVDILFNNSGQLVGGLFEKQDLAQIESMMQVNLLGLIRLTHAILPGMLERKRGKIINHSSVSAVMHLPTASTYAASKAAVMAFTNCLQIELENTGVSTLLLLTPGIETRMYQEIPKKHGTHFKMNLGQGMSPKLYAQKIREALLEDLPILRPSGVQGASLWVAQMTPGVFAKAVKTRFHR